jgi:hypothetical protein
LIEIGENILSFIVDADGEENMICTLSLVNLKKKTRFIDRGTKYRNKEAVAPITRKWNGSWGSFTRRTTFRRNEEMWQISVGKRDTGRAASRTRTAY